MQITSVEIWHDEWNESPREWCNVGTLCSTSEYVPSDQDADWPTVDLIPDDALVSWACSELDKADLRDIADNRRRHGGSKGEAVRDWVHTCYTDASDYPESLLSALAEHCIMIPVYAYVHGGVRLNTGGFSCPWDSGCIGVIWCSLDKARKEWSGSDWRERAESYLRGEIETLDTYYVQGAYGFSLLDADGEVVDSCGGFLGWDPATNGMHEQVPAELHDALSQAMDDIGVPVEV